MCNTQTGLDSRVPTDRKNVTLQRNDVGVVGELTV